jgi:hypothetical protein
MTAGETMPQVLKRIALLAAVRIAIGHSIPIASLYELASMRPPIAKMPTRQSADMTAIPIGFIQLQQCLFLVSVTENTQRG